MKGDKCLLINMNHIKQLEEINLRIMPRKEIPAEMEKFEKKNKKMEPATERSIFIRLYRWCQKLTS